MTTTPETRVVPAEPVATAINEAQQERWARRKVRAAISSGLLKRAKYCSACGSADTPAVDGRTTIQGHHYAGYGQPLLVEWLCAKCHRAVTPLPATPGAPVFGSRNGQARLTETEVAAIRSSEMGCVRLSKKYGVDKKTIQRIRNGKQWAHSVETNNG